MSYNKKYFKVNKKGIFLPKYTLNELDGLENKTNPIKSINQYLELFVKATSVITILAIVIGGMNIFGYLHTINHLFLFSEVIGFSYAFMSMLVVYFLFTFITCVVFISPFLSHIFLIKIDDLKNKKKITSDDKNTNKNIPLLSINPKIYEFLKKILKKILENNILKFLNIFFIKNLLSIVVYLIHKIIKISLSLYSRIENIFFNIFFYEKQKRDILHLSRFVHWGIFWSTILFNTIFFISLFLPNINYDGFIYEFIIIYFLFFLLYNIIFINNNEEFQKNKIYTIFSALMLAVILMLPSLMLITLLLNAIGVTDNINLSLILYFIGILIYSFYLCMSHNAFHHYQKNKKYPTLNIFISLSFSFFYTLSISVFSNYNLSLYKVRFIEKPQDSSWYLIHNSNTSSEAINGMTNEQIMNLQKEFSPKSQCVAYDKVLFGYIAWNLGSTKVFCPVSVDFFENTAGFFYSEEEHETIKNTNIEKSKKCLVIDSKHLQPINPEYLVD